MLSRAAVEVVVNTLTLDTLMAAIEFRDVNVNEYLLASLDVSRAIDLPGGFTQLCLQAEPPDYFASRFVFLPPFSARGAQKFVDFHCQIAQTARTEITTDIVISPCKRRLTRALRPATVTNIAASGSICHYFYKLHKRSHTVWIRTWTLAPSSAFMSIFS